ncbi:MAG: flagellin lysine-N-methylase [Oscillospiraceae bacterium]|nr:flagellin lysine-N-methylase [Oscillospiraceae bacterium]
MGFYNIIEPKYFGGFKCTGSACPQNCCGRWERVLWTNEEYERLVSREMPEELRVKIGSAFVKEQNARNINLSNLACPFLSENGLCSLQLTFGEEILSATCAMYPRTAVFNNSVLTRGCFSSCPEVLRILSEDENALEISLRTVQVHGNTVEFKAVSCENEQDFAKNPALAFRNELFGLFFDIISEKSAGIQTNLAIGAVAAKTLSEVSENELPEAIEKLAKRLDETDFLDEREFMGKPLAGELFAELFGERLENHDEKRLAEIFAGREYFFRNLAKNLLFELKMPFYLTERGIFENFLVYGTAVTLAEFLAAACAVDGNAELVLARLAELDRMTAHDKNAAGKILAFLEKAAFSGTICSI